ncbi:MAG: hypothetical protein AAGF11_29080 [Myxococcota bacterium]
MALIVGACGDEGHGTASNAELGVLGYAQFQWRCTGNGDLACEPEFESTLPRHVALGARFDLDFELAERVPDSLREGSLVLASPVGMRASSFDYETTAPGLVTLIALTADGAVVDFARFEIREVVELEIVHDCERLYETDDDGREVSLCGQAVEATQPMGAMLSVRVEPFGGDDPLMGDLDYTWESRTPDRVSVSVEGRGGNEAQLELLRPGAAEIVVRTGSVEQVLSLEIEAGPVDASGPRRTRPGSETDGDPSDSSDTETTTETDAGSEGSGSTGGIQ